METLNAKNAKEMLSAVANAIIINKPLLTEIDSETGDGDHGIGMELGMKNAAKKISQMESCTNVYELFEAFGREMVMSMGGASGIIFGSMFMAGAKKQPPASEISSLQFAEMFQRSLIEIKKRGGAQAGDKTMIDAFEPAVLAMLEHNQDGFADMLQIAAEAAGEGAESTVDMIAKYGRAKSLMERSRGHKDAGAVSTSIIIRTMAEYIKSV